MKKYIYSLMAFGLLIVAQSCNDYLEETNPNFLSSDTYWTDLNESESNLTSVYSAMLHQYVLGIEEEFLRTDIAFPGQRTRPTGIYLPWYQQRVTSDLRALSDRWDAKYQVIFRANQVIEGLNGMSEELKSDERWTRQMAEARFFRGLMHFYLHSTFNNGSIIIRDAVPVTVQDFSKPLSSSEEVLAFFREDLMYAFNNLPAQGIPVTRVDKAFAATILGTSHLYEGEYAQAQVYFDDLINNGEYGLQLEQDVSKIFTNAGEFSVENIFEINYADDKQPEDGSFDEDSFQNRLARRTGPNGRNLEIRQTFGGQGWITPSAWLTYEYSTEPIDTQDPRNTVDGELRPISLRAAQSIAVVNDEISPYYGYTAPQVFGFAGTRFSLFKKYTNHTVVTREFDTNTTPWESGRNVVVNRLGGVYLMYAECLTKTGDVSGAIATLNELRKRWGLQLLGMSDGSAHDFDGVAYDETSLMDHLMYKEYPLELAMEGFSTRFINLRRWGITQQRFQELSTRVFSLANYTYTRTNGNTANRNRSLVQEGSGPNEFTEYLEAAAAWAANDLGYFPLPQSETLNNQNVN
ncbi:RagB/SusD family nutrient uptake outer membrane protein [Seonamhaeicola marinus]|uniref:RagB/SusD family nutrient uptake outer membrane protein n=1 Tax=Seonamhaeicola marinus TaxID=1912246 RepID=A0A5D0HK86_9FLAO|nr:RagB/SusD family nutrient uptake outer membrane protein [Seonamhaeicola marinus]TYA71731.1 RagB/SusD family nutrient uptake outer membrane protein [Seonamhaeicola marinus]